ncbi:BgTH12-01601 [Blumeria graminis f. sp. triticale]|uniref:Bgt-169 n=3 Tax=Blumeria graminis TaxID=34373 RepID=A0A061HE23_BLUGR|nr:GTP-binding protein [Blumeria graminis f. sp. tritici 96224]CAD6501349.1 BgTH12-01601 [Blumeria graminis f. sp. triticale]VDB83840.1 Bgt-169 [Blumeria graminis f. sp. tritici]
MDGPHNLTITICGDGGTGKSSITLRLVRSQWISNYDPTIEDSYSVTRQIDGEAYRLAITDTAGQEEYRDMWTASNLNSDAFLLVYDITRHQSLDALEEFNSLIDQEGQKRSSSQKPVKILAANKCDRPENREVLTQTGLEWARARGCGFMETSAKDMLNIEKVFELVVRNVMATRRSQKIDHLYAWNPKQRERSGSECSQDTSTSDFIQKETIFKTSRYRLGWPKRDLQQSSDVCSKARSEGGAPLVKTRLYRALKGWNEERATSIDEKQKKHEKHRWCSRFGCAV